MSNIYSKIEYITDEEMESLKADALKRRAEKNDLKIRKIRQDDRVIIEKRGKKRGTKISFNE